MTVHCGLQTHTCQLKKHGSEPSSNDQECFGSCGASGVCIQKIECAERTTSSVPRYASEKQLRTDIEAPLDHGALAVPYEPSDWILGTTSRVRFGLVTVQTRRDGPFGRSTKPAAQAQPAVCRLPPLGGYPQRTAFFGLRCRLRSPLDAARARFCCSLIAKVPRSHRWPITVLGQRLIPAVIRTRNGDARPAGRRLICIFFYRYRRQRIYLFQLATNGRWFLQQRPHKFFRIFELVGFWILLQSLL